MSRRPSELPIYTKSPSDDKDPPTPPESIRSFRLDSVSTLCEPTSAYQFPPSSQTSNYSSLLCLLDWAIKVLGVASAVLFGIWAPISYRAQVTGNVSNDDAQERLVDRVEKLSEELERLGRKMDALGGLRGWEFCEKKERSTLQACASLTSSLKLPSLLSDLASTRQKHKPSSRRTPVAAPPTTTPSTALPDPTPRISPSISNAHEAEKRNQTTTITITATQLSSSTSTLSPVIISRATGTDTNTIRTPLVPLPTPPPTNPHPSSHPYPNPQLDSHPYLNPGAMSATFVSGVTCLFLVLVGLRVVRAWKGRWSARMRITRERKEIEGLG